MLQVHVHWIGKGLTEHLHGCSKLIWIQIAFTNCRSNGETRKLQYRTIYEYILKTKNSDCVVGGFKKCIDLKSYD